VCVAPVAVVLEEQCCENPEQRERPQDEADDGDTPRRGGTVKSRGLEARVGIEGRA
jgi:hypothetical protein